VAYSITVSSCNGHSALSLSNGEVEVAVSSAMGPRVLRYGFIDGPNFFKEMSAVEERRLTGDQPWKVYGGHRIWIGPERLSYTYAPDNDPPSIVRGDSSILAVSPVDEAGVEKAIEVRLAPSGSGATVVHRLTNRSLWPLRFAPWALSMMAPGGFAVAPFPDRGTHPEDLPPSNPLVMWAFTNWTDPRWRLLEKYIILRQDPAASSPEKAGLFRPLTAAAYCLGDDVFVKTYRAKQGLEYPDMGCSLELFANDMFLEIETLGPIEEVEPGRTLEHVEEWSLHRGAGPGRLDDGTLDEAILPLLNRG
jgi:hypothetical protein